MLAELNTKARRIGEKQAEKNSKKVNHLLSKYPRRIHGHNTSAAAIRRFEAEYLPREIQEFRGISLFPLEDGVEIGDQVQEKEKGAQDQAVESHKSPCTPDSTGPHWTGLGCTGTLSKISNLSFKDPNITIEYPQIQVQSQENELRQLEEVTLEDLGPDLDEECISRVQKDGQEQLEIVGIKEDEGGGGNHDIRLPKGLEIEPLMREEPNSTHPEEAPPAPTVGIFAHTGVATNGWGIS